MVPAVCGQITNETVSLCASAAPRSTLTRFYDALGRPVRFALDGGHAVSYAYDMYGRLSQVSNFQFQVSYSYLDGSDLLEATTFTIGSSTFDVRRSYESGRSLVTSVENRFGETVISRYDYANDALGRRTSRADSGLAFANPAFDAYSYNARSEVTGAQRYHGGGLGSLIPEQESIGK